MNIEITKRDCEHRDPDPSLSKRDQGVDIVCGGRMIARSVSESRHLSGGIGRTASRTASRYCGKAEWVLGYREKRQAACFLLGYVDHNLPRMSVWFPSSREVTR